MNHFNSAKTIWLVIANSVKAEIYAIENQSSTLVTVLENPEGRLKSKELTSDKPGSYGTSHTARGQFSFPHDPHKEEHLQFAKKIADFLEYTKNENKYQEFILCAEAGFQGLINEALSKHVQYSLLRKIDKDYIPLPESEKENIIKTLIRETPH
jgi:protein required for attachment to host cells